MLEWIDNLQCTCGDSQHEQTALCPMWHETRGQEASVMQKSCLPNSVIKGMLDVSK